MSPINDKKNLVLVGGGGHCKACIDVIETTDIKIAGVLDKEIIRGNDVLNYEVIGSDDDIEELIKKGYLFLVTVGQIKNSTIRSQLYQKIKDQGGKLATVIASSSIISKYSTVGEGTIVMHQAVINASARIGNNSIINNKALIEHDCVVGDHTHISTGAIINGTCVIGDRTFVGSNSVIAQRVQIVDDVVIGAGSLVLKSILQPGIFAGNPVRKISE